VNPFDGSASTTFEPAVAANVDEALAAAARGARAMASLPAHRRQEILGRAAALLEERREDVARDLVREAGKPIRDARVEVDRCVVTLRTSGEEAARILGEVLPLDATKNGVGRFGVTRRFPIGVVTAISPFNFPLNLPAHKVGPALAAGNSVILKPAPRTPICGFHLAAILHEAGLPPEALSVLPGDPPVIDPLIDDPRVAMVSFTGSAAVGWQIKARAHKKKVTLELGGNAAAIVHADAHRATALARCIAGSFTYAGQVCIRSQRLLVHESIYGGFARELAARAAALKVGNPMDESTDLGPMIDAAAAARAWGWVEEAVGAGAKLLLGKPPAGSLLSPVILERVPRDARASREEIFAPVVTLEPYSSLDDALESVDASRYGLQAGIFTNDVGVVWRAFERLSVGAVIHNDVPMFRSDPMPYGGVKDSGFGREGVRYAILDMTEPRLLVLRPDPSA
jgi:glyceraldehyde-3-phosphate dehydrogenase (NADP+)